MANCKLQFCQSFERNLGEGTWCLRTQQVSHFRPHYNGRKDRILNKILKKQKNLTFQMEVQWI